MPDGAGFTDILAFDENQRGARDLRGILPPAGTRTYLALCFRKLRA